MADPDPPVEVELTIAARPETIVRYFTDPARFARWMGQGSVLEAEPGGRLRVGYPTGQVAGGTRLELRGAPESCHGVVRFAWAALGPGEAVLATGTNVAEADLDGGLPLGDRLLGSVNLADRVDRDPKKCDESPRSALDFAHWQRTRQALRIRWSQVGPAPRGADDPRSRRPAASGRTSYGE